MKTLSCVLSFKILFFIFAPSKDNVYELFPRVDMVFGAVNNYNGSGGFLDFIVSSKLDCEFLLRPGKPS